MVLSKKGGFWLPVSPDFNVTITFEFFLHFRGKVVQVIDY
jgi:hypothetical protein